MAARSMTDFRAARVRDLAPSPTLAVSDKARQLKAQGVDVIDLGGGDPDFITAAHIRAAASDAMNSGDTHYVSSPGIPALRKAIAQKLKHDNNVDVDWNGGVVVTPGGKQALFEAALALVEPGVDVLIPEPAWVSYTPMVALAGGRNIPVPLDPENQFTLTREALERAVTPGSRIIMICSPNNPTGRVLTINELTAVAEFAREHDLIVFADEMYEKILYDGAVHTSIATLPDMAERTLIFNGFSKAYAMTGWRLGYVAGPKPLIAEIEKVQGHSATCATSFVQTAGVAALSGPQEFIGEMVSAWDRRRHNLTTGINAINGLHLTLPEGAFYAFVDIRETGMSSTEASDLMLREAHVAGTPGIAFGDAGEGFIRFSFATGDHELETAVERLGALYGFRSS